MGIDFHEWTVGEIKELLKRLGLPTSGKKRELIARLEDSETVNVTQKIFTLIEEIEKGGTESAQKFFSTFTALAQEEE